MCGDKSAIAGAGNARGLAREHAQAKTDGADTWRAYRCPDCELWHLTTKVET